MVFGQTEVSKSWKAVKKIIKKFSEKYNFSEQVSPSLREDNFL
jgi:hypothetical protein